MTAPADISEEILEALPAVLAEVARLSGLRAALELAAEHGGAEVYVPRRPSEASPLAKVIGLEAAASIARIYGGENLEIPLGPCASASRRRQEIRRMLDAGVSGLEIARRLHITARTVRRHKAHGGEASANLDLFRQSES